MRRDDFLGDVYQVAQPIVLLSLSLLSHSDFLGIPASVRLRESVWAQNVRIHDLSTSFLTSERSTGRKMSIIRERKNQDIAMWNVKTVFLRISVV